MKEYDLIGDVGYDITAQQVSSMLAMANGEDITFYIASLGGALDHGITIHGLIKKYNGKTRGVLIGNTASAGTVIGMGCDTLDANASAPFLIHNSSDPEGGNAETLIKKAGQLKRHDALMVSIYKAKTKLPESTIKSLMQKEDWLTPAEAKSYGFIDSVITAKYKAVAYHSENKLSNDLINKLEKKMKIFANKSKDGGNAHILALKDGSNLLINAEVAAEGVEVAPVGAMTLEDGSFELADGRTIKVEGGLITEVVEVEAVAAEELDVDAIVEAVTPIVTAAIAEVETKMNAKIEAMVKTVGSHTPPKGNGVVVPNAKVESPSVSARIKEVTDGIRKKLVESRKN